MKHYTKWTWCPYNRKWICEYVELTDDHWFDAIGEHTVYAEGNEPQLIKVEVKYFSKKFGKHHWNGQKHWEPAGIYSIAKVDKTELHRLMKVWFPNCEFKYLYR